MKQPTYTKFFDSESRADSWCRTKTRANRMPRWIFVVIDGPQGDFAVVDIRTAQSIGGGYRWWA